MSEKQPKKKKTAGDIVLTVVLIAAICVFCYAGYNLFHIYTEYKKGTDEYNEIAQMAVTERDPDGEEAGPSAGELKAPMNIDFASLKSVNDDGALEEVLKKVIANDPATVEAYRAGKEKVLGALVGHAMKETKGKANPALLKEKLKEMLQENFTVGSYLC